MLDQFKSLLSSRDEESLIQLISSHPNLLDHEDDLGRSMYSTLGYHGLPQAFQKANELKSSFSFHEAILAGRKSQIKSNLERDPTLLNAFSNDGFSPIALAAFFDQNEIAIFLIEQGADVNLQATNPSKVNALHAAIAKENIALCKAILVAGADVNRGQTQDVTPLHSAVHRNNIELATLLLEAGAKIELAMENGDTTLSIANKEGFEKLITILSKYENH